LLVLGIEEANTPATQEIDRLLKEIQEEEGKDKRRKSKKGNVKKSPKPTKTSDSSSGHVDNQTTTPITNRSNLNVLLYGGAAKGMLVASLDLTNGSVMSLREVGKYETIGRVMVASSQRKIYSFPFSGLVFHLIDLGMS